MYLTLYHYCFSFLLSIYCWVAICQLIINMMMMMMCSNSKFGNWLQNADNLQYQSIVKFEWIVTCERPIQPAPLTRPPAPLSSTVFFQVSLRFAPAYPVFGPAPLHFPLPLRSHAIDKNEILDRVYSSSKIPDSHSSTAYTNKYFVITVRKYSLQICCVVSWLARLM